MKASHFDIDSATRTSGSTASPEVMTFARNITTDLILHGLSPTGSIRDKCDRLKNSLSEEFTFKEHKRSLTYLGRVGSEEALFVLTNTLPCILHLENRVGLKIFTRILEIGLENAKNELILGNVASKKHWIESFLRTINDISITSI